MDSMPSEQWLRHCIARIWFPSFKPGMIVMSFFNAIGGLSSAENHYYPSRKAGEKD